MEPLEHKAGDELDATAPEDAFASGSTAGGAGRLAASIGNQAFTALVARRRPSAGDAARIQRFTPLDDALSRLLGGELGRGLGTGEMPGFDGGKGASPFDPGYGGKGSPQNGSKQQQDQIAAQIWADSGSGAWVCAG